MIVMTLEARKDTVPTMVVLCGQVDAERRNVRINVESAPMMMAHTIMMHKS